MQQTENYSFGLCLKIAKKILAIEYRSRHFGAQREAIKKDINASLIILLKHQYLKLSE